MECNWNRIWFYWPINILLLLFCRIARWIDEEEERIKSTGETSLQYVILNMSGKYSITNNSQIKTYICIHFVNIDMLFYLSNIYFLGSTAVGNIDTSGISMLDEVKKIIERRGLKVHII